MTNSIASQLEKLQQEIANSCAKRKNFQENVRLVAVSKRHSAENILSAYQAGQVEFGENYVQEGIEKIQQLSAYTISWHMIGAIQSRKCRDIAQHFDWVQTVDRTKIATKLAQHRPQESAPLNCCIQLNAFNEPQKAGCSPDELMDLARIINELPQLALRGLMVIPPKTPNDTVAQEQFAKVQQFYQQLQDSFPSVDTLSMGMSGDFEQAIQANSTLIRVGTAIFGQRD